MDVVEGPRALQPNEWQQVRALVNAALFPGMFERYPQLFNEPNRENLRVMAANGRVVSHVGMTKRPATLLGCRVDVACVGGVATLEDQRGRGYASALFQDACDKAAGDGIDFMLISGARGLYTRVGCRRVGADAEYDVTPEHAPRLRGLAPDVEVRPIESVDIAATTLAALYEAEPNRFLRPREDWQWALESGWALNRAARIFAFGRNGTGRAYCVVWQPASESPEPAAGPTAPRFSRVAEFAGDRTAIVAGLAALVQRLGVERLVVHVGRWDTVLQSMLKAAGLTPTPAHVWGTLRVINFPQLMERLRPLLAARLGQYVAGRLRFWADAPLGAPEGRFGIRHAGAEVVVTGIDALGVFLFGTVDPAAAAAAQPVGSDRLRAQLAQVLPFPALWYGLNFA
ncbi:MAG: GNAT family N-acetyltransferase [Chloroflexi bacterium]|nr:GNAT family N-acetyltransferase [Chloroflexota bacterium]